MNLYTTNNHAFHSRAFQKKKKRKKTAMAFFRQSLNFRLNTWSISGEEIVLVSVLTASCLHRTNYNFLLRSSFALRRSSLQLLASCKLPFFGYHGYPLGPSVLVLVDAVELDRTMLLEQHKCSGVVRQTATVWKQEISVVYQVGGRKTCCIHAVAAMATVSVSVLHVKTMQPAAYTQLLQWPRYRCPFWMRNNTTCCIQAVATMTTESTYVLHAKTTQPAAYTQLLQWPQNRHLFCMRKLTMHATCCICYKDQSIDIRFACEKNTVNLLHACM